MNTALNTTQTAAYPQALVSTTVRALTAVAVAVCVFAAWHSAGQASNVAVRNSTAALAVVTHVTLPSVVVVGRRDLNGLTAAAASSTLPHRDSAGKSL